MGFFNSVGCCEYVSMLKIHTFPRWFPVAGYYFIIRHKAAPTTSQSALSISSISNFSRFEQPCRECLVSKPWPHTHLTLFTDNWIPRRRIMGQSLCMSLRLWNILPVCPPEKLRQITLPQIIKITIMVNIYTALTTCLTQLQALSISWVINPPNRTMRELLLLLPMNTYETSSPRKSVSPHFCHHWVLPFFFSS